MARVFGLIFFFIVLVFGLSFAALNADLVQINYYFGSRQVPLSLILVFAVVVGALFGALANVIMIVRLKRQISKLRRDMKFTEKEVKNLRSLPIKDEH